MRAVTLQLGCVSRAVYQAMTHLMSSAKHNVYREGMDKTVLRDVGTVLTTRSAFLRMACVKMAVSSAIKALSAKLAVMTVSMGETVLSSVVTVVISSVMP